MVTKAELYKIADQMVAEGKVPKNREIREHLPNGGSFEDVSPLFKQWRNERRYHPALATLNLSKNEAGALAKAVKIIRASLASDDRDNHANSDGKAEDNAAIISELKTQVAALEDENERLQNDAATRRRQERAPIYLKPIRRAGDRSKGVYAATQRFFWNAVMREIYGILRAGPMPATDILDLLHPDTLLLVQMLGNKELNEPELVSQMRKRKAEGYYFAEPSDRVFMRSGKTRGEPIFSAKNSK